MRVQDIFKRGNQSGFGTASSGLLWTTNGLGTLSVASNEGVIVSQATDTHVQLGSQTGTDMVVLCRVAIANVGDVAGIAGRYSTAGGINCYKLVWYGGNIHLNRQNAGTVTEITNVAFTMTVSTFYWFKLQMIGSKLYGKVWQSGTNEPGGFTTTTTDASVASGGCALLANTATATGVQFDNFSATSFASVLRAPSRMQRRVVA